MNMGGYAGQILHVNLSSGNIEKKPLDRDFARKHIGGLGFGTQIYLDLIKEFFLTAPVHIRSKAAT